MACGPRPPVRLIACGALAREILALGRLNGGVPFDLVCLPANLHNRPEQIPWSVRAKIRQARADGFDKIFVLYADCGTGGELDQVLAEEGVERLAGPHCYATFMGQAAFLDHAEAEPGCFYLTDYLARQFDHLVIEGLGIDRHPELLPLYFGNYDKLVYLAQTRDPAILAKAEAAAARLGLDFEHRWTGYGELADVLRQVA
jgi:hypothetical protein